MFRDILSGSRAIFIGVVFFVLVVGGSLLYSWHVHRTTDAELAETQRKVQPLKNDKVARTAEDTVDTSTVDFGHAETPLETAGTQPMSDDTGVSSIDETSDGLDLSDTFLPDDFVSEEAPAEDVPVSPFGFGPYPEVPADFPFPESALPWTWSEEETDDLERLIQSTLKLRGVSFTEHMKQTELMFRVGIKLWNEGHRFDGLQGSDKTGLIYPNYPDVVYIQWRETERANGEVSRYISTAYGSAISAISISAWEGREPLPDWLDVRSLNDGIDPYMYLDFNR